MYKDRLDGRIAVEVYDKLVKEDVAEMQKIDDELMRLAEHVENDQNTVSDLLKLATYARELFQGSKPAVQN